MGQGGGEVNRSQILKVFKARLRKLDSITAKYCVCTPAHVCVYVWCTRMYVVLLESIGLKM